MRTGQVYGSFRTKHGESITLRSLGKGDTNACTAFINQLVRERRAFPELGITIDRIMTRKEEEERFLSKMLEGIRRNNAVSVAAFTGGKMVGNCDISRRPPSDLRHTGALGIALLDGYRDLGLGQRMVTLLLRNAKKIGVTLVELEVFANNSRAIHVYEKLGFKEAGRIPGKIHRNGKCIDIVLMYAQL